MASVLLLNDTTNWYHFGCTATSLALKEQIVKAGYALTAKPISETYTNLESIPSTWEEFQSKAVFEDFAKANDALISSIAEHDIIILNGEGTLHGTRPAPLKLLYLTYTAKVFLGKNVQIINHSVYPQDDLSLTDNMGTDLYRNTYNALDFIAIREPLSYELMQKLNVPCIESFDCTPLYIRDQYTRHNQKDKNTLLLAGSAAWLNASNILHAKESNIEAVKLGLDQFVTYINEMASRGFKIQFLYGAQAYPSQDDRDLIDFLKLHVMCKWELIIATTLNEWLSYIEKATLLVSGRFHHSLAAHCLGSHFIALNSNTPKIQGLMQAIGYSDVLTYDNPRLSELLLHMTEELLKLPNPEVHLDDLCSSAMQNFSALYPTRFESWQGDKW